MTASSNLQDLPYTLEELIFFATQQNFLGLKIILDTIYQYAPIAFTLTRDKFSAATQSPYPIYDGVLIVINPNYPSNPALDTPDKIAKAIVNLSGPDVSIFVFACETLLGINIRFSYTKNP